LNGTYTDYNLVNGETYGYKMKTVGYYSSDGLPTHIENFSQEVYATPVDTIAPCVNITLKSFCTEAYNRISWHPDSACGLGIAKYFLYYSETLDGEMKLLQEFKPEVSEYDHYPELGMAGCYMVTAQDSAGNRGVVRERVCIDKCEYYRLPNVFTPNGDGKNDLFHPYPYQFVDHIDMTITDRWGREVFTTTDPDINWDASDKSTGKPVPDGVYFYRCTVYEHRLTGLEERDLEGYITIFSKKTKY
jgi:gliding motility-associated-like protein